MKDIRDAFLLWICGNASFLASAALHSFSDYVPTPLAIAMMSTAVTGYLAGAMFMIVGGVSFFFGLRNLRKNP